MNAFLMRRFLLRQPRPAKCVVTSNGDKREMNVKRVGQNWSRLGESIVALEPELVELYGSDDSLLRALRPDSETELSDQSYHPPNVLLEDPETARLTHFANLLHRAYEHSTVVAFTKLVELVERIDARSDAIEARLERTESNYRRALQQQVDDAFERAEEALEHGNEGTALEQMASAFVQGAARKRRDSSNGKAKDPEA